MKVIIAGSRTIHDMAILEQDIARSGFDITEVVSGCAKGVDMLGAQWAAAKHIPTRLFPADWDRHGKAAGPIRNKEMAAYADALILIWDGVSPGSKNMRDEARRAGLATYIHTCSRSPNALA